MSDIKSNMAEVARHMAGLEPSKDARIAELTRLFHQAPIASQYHGQQGFNLDAFLHDYGEWRVKARAAIASVEGKTNE